MLDSKKLQDEIEKIVITKRLSYLDALVLFCAENDLDGEDIKSIISPALKDKIYLVAQDEGYVRKTSRLPL